MIRAAASDPSNNGQVIERITSLSDLPALETQELRGAAAEIPPGAHPARNITTKESNVTTHVDIAQLPLLPPGKPSNGALNGHAALPDNWDRPPVSRSYQHALQRAKGQRARCLREAEALFRTRIVGGPGRVRARLERAARIYQTLSDAEHTTLAIELLD
jgi:hypothetical protein